MAEPGPADRSTVTDEGLETVLDLDASDRESLHVEVDDPALDAPFDEDVALDDAHLDPLGNTLDDLVDAFAGCFNAHDLDGAVELLHRDVELPGLGNDLDGFAAAVCRLWDERPNAVLTRGRLGDDPVAVLWDVGDNGTWSRAALMTFDRSDDDSEIGLIELVGDATPIEDAVADPPESELSEGVRWEEWYEGDGD